MELKSEHPLLVGTKNHIETWDQWQQLWNNAPVIEFRAGLLHIGFEVPYKGHSPWDQGNETRDRISFYLDVATLPLPDTTGRMVELSGKRLEKLAAIAFKGIALKFMKDNDYAWINRRNLEQLVTILVQTDEQSGTMSRVPHLYHNNHVREVLDKWCRKFCSDSFTRVGYAGDYGATALQCLDIKIYRPRLIPLLIYYGLLDILVSPGVVDMVDVTCIDALKSALSRERIDGYRPLPGETQWRRPVTVAEACYAGSDIARTLLVLDTIGAERVRLAKRAEILKRQHEDAHELASLK